MRSLHAGVIVGLLLAQIFFCNLLQQCGDVEPNPGPPKPDCLLRQTRLNSKSDTGAARRESAGGEKEKAVNEATGSSFTLNDVMDRLAAVDCNIETKFATMDSKFATMDSNIDRKFASMDSSFGKKLADLGEELYSAYSKVREDVVGLRDEVVELRQENADLRSKLDELVMKTDDLECRSRRNNLLFHGLNKMPRETPQECEQIVCEFLTDKLELGETVQFDRVHRTSNKPNAPVLARCTFYKDKVIIMKAKAKLRGTNIFVGEDFSTRVRDIRKKLTPHLKAAKGAGKRATMVYDYLLIEGIKFVLDGVVGIKQVPKQQAEI